MIPEDLKKEWLKGAEFVERAARTPVEERLLYCDRVEFYPADPGVNTPVMSIQFFAQKCLNSDLWTVTKIRNDTDVEQMPEKRRLPEVVEEFRAFVIQAEMHECPDMRAVVTRLPNVPHYSDHPDYDENPAKFADNDFRRMLGVREI